MTPEKNARKCDFCVGGHTVCACGYLYWEMCVCMPEESMIMKWPVQAAKTNSMCLVVQMTGTADPPRIPNP